MPYLKLGQTIPFWIDKVNTMSPSFYYKNYAPATAGMHLMTLLNRHPRSYIAIMAYRDYYDGPDGTVDLVEDELEFLRTKNYPTKVIIGQETANVAPSFITYHGESDEDLKYNAVMIDAALSGYNNYQGFSIHTADDYMNLR
jgi:hypothetical protein